VKVVGGPRRTLYLCRLGSFYLCLAKLCCPADGKAKYFREGSKRLYVTMPTWFRDQTVARLAAKAQGFRVVSTVPPGAQEYDSLVRMLGIPNEQRSKQEQAMMGTANGKPKSPKRRAGGKTCH